MPVISFYLFFSAKGIKILHPYPHSGVVAAVVKGVALHYLSFGFISYYFHHSKGVLLF